MCKTAKKPQIGAETREAVDRGTPLFPLQIYEADVHRYPVFWHWHDDWEIIECVGGSVRVAVQSETVVLQAGEAVFLDACVIHRVTGARTGGVIRSVVFQPRVVASIDGIIWQKYVQPILQKVGVVPLSPDVPWQAACIASFDRCWDAMREKPPGYEFCVRESLSDVIFQIYTERGAERLGLSGREIRDDARMHAMVAFMQAHYSEDISIADIAESALIGESECLRCFRNTVDTTPGRYLRELRMQKAAELLIRTGEKVGDIGAACGFPDAAYFSKLFRESFGCTPLAYRAMHGKT